VQWCKLALSATSERRRRDGECELMSKPLFGDEVMKFTVITGWQAAYDSPIRLQAGDLLFLTGRQETWDGHVWLWARSAGGLEGWIPDILVGRAEGKCVANEDYTASELTCRPGQVLVGEKETHGWVFCRAKDGSTGWIPRKNLSPELN
jgi:hypothetical protein